MNSSESTNAPRESSSSADAIARGSSFLDAGHAAEALDCLAIAHESDPANARLRSYYGLSLVLATRRFEQGVELGRSALKQEFFNPELYLNIAHMYLSFGFKAEALRYLRRGAMIDPADESIRALVDELGSRQSQILRFLPRGHLFNRLLGRARACLRIEDREVRAA